MTEGKSTDLLKPKDGPELVIGIVAPVGAKAALVCDVLESELKKFGYTSQEIRVSSLLHQLKKYKHLAKSRYPSEYERIREHMTAGTQLRTDVGRGDVLSLLAISKIRQLREWTNEKLEVEENLRSRKPLHRTAFILRSLKHPEEISTLRDVYGKAFFMISAYMPRSNRVDALAEVIAKSVHDFDTRAYREKSEELIWIDEQEEGSKLGQNVSDAFPLADLFVDTRSREQVEKSVSRFFELVFGYPFHTPTRDEFAMFHARSAALRSADLSRQVGASIANDDGDIIAVGCNDVPKASGGLYWAGDPGDDRDFVRGYDSSAKFKADIVAEVIDRFGKNEWLSDAKKSLPVPELVKDLLHGDGKKVLQDTQILNLLEYGRPVHAEMAALMDAARRGVEAKNCTLYTTTFPCHLCARHIIAAGIKRVVYIEPYPKSMAHELYSDSVVIDPPHIVKDRVHFEPFVGIAPVRYMSLFESPGKRKDNEGKSLAWEKNRANPRIKRFVLSYLLIEDEVVGEIVPQLLAVKSLELP